MAPDPAALDWRRGGGLLPAIVQDATSGAVLMLGYMSLEALEQTVRTRRVTFFSRSRRRLWVKGETSGNRLEAVSISADCDGDAILVVARPAGPVCHAGTATCFPSAPPPAAARLGFLAELEAVIASRIAEPRGSSYTARLHAAGPRRVAQKVGEEGLELALAAACGSEAEVVAECADLVYHLTLALQERGVSLDAVVAELERRHQRGAARGHAAMGGRRASSHVTRVKKLDDPGE
jgi:phosphoribosyl-ATP pyrophosphohydrolase/phosphoribosyl-AMP cyclohydrolase